MSRQPTCRERLPAELTKTLKTVRNLWALYQQDPEAYDDDSGRIDDYGLSFEYVEPEDGAPFFRWLLSWGGPSDEFRFYVSPNSNKPYRIEYRFMDWFDGASRNLTGRRFELLAEIWENYFAESAQYMIDEALEGRR